MREALLEALAYADLKRGLGSERQQKAYQELEWRKCSRDYEYFRCNYCWIIVKSGDIIPWDDPYPINVVSAAEWAEGESSIEVKTRQCAETTNGVHFAAWEAMFKDAVRWNFFGADREASADMKSRLDATMDRLPPWMKSRAQMTTITKSEKDIKKSQKQEAATIISFGLSKILIYTGSVKKAQGLAGKTLWDDAGKHTDPERKWQLLYPTIDDPDPKNRGQVIIIFNGNGEDFLHSLYQKSKRGETVLKAHFYSWKDDPRRLWAVYDGIGPHCVRETREEVYPWYENAKAQYLMEHPEQDEVAFRAQYPETERDAFGISENSRFQLKVLEGLDLAAKAMPPADIGYLRKEDARYLWERNSRVGHMRLYEHPAKDGVYIIGIDTAGGHAASDYSVMQVCRLWQRDEALIRNLCDKFGYVEPPKVMGTPAFQWEETSVMLEQVLTYQAKQEPTKLAMIAERLANYYNEALIVVEANNHGQTFINEIKDTYWNLYREQRKVKIADEDTERLGYWTGHTSKEPLIDDLAGWLQNAWIATRDQPTINECRTYGYHETQGGATKLGCPKGKNDDLVIGLALCVVGAKSLRDMRVGKKSKIWMPWEM
jgi:hypothetical protein